MLSGRFPEKSVRVRLTNVFSPIAKEEQESLDDFRHFDYILHLDLLHCIAPAAALQELLGSCLQSQALKIQLSALLVNELVLVSLGMLICCKFVLNGLLDDLIYFFVKFYIMVWFFTKHLYSAVAVHRQVLSFGALPLRTVGFYRAENPSPVLLTNFTVLPHSVQANDKFGFDSFELLEFNLHKLFNLLFIMLASRDSRFILRCLFMIVGLQVGLKSLVLGSYSLEICNGNLESVII